MEFKHIPVMLEECMQGLNLKDNAVYFDGTLGGAGHSSEILKRTTNSKLIATDLDKEAISAASKKLAEYEGRFTLINDNFKNFKYIIEENGIGLLDGILLDLGVSSYQLDERSRGFSYMARDVRPDMRMNTEQELSAWEVINTYSEKELVNILYKYGEEKFSERIAKNICQQRQIKTIDTTGELIDIIDKSIPAKFKKDGHPAKRTFQAIRIEVNGELKGLEQVIKDMVFGLKKGGRMAVITFHSLEDRIVKTTFKDLETSCVCDKSFPICVCGRRQELKLINKKPIEASIEECENNSRSKCAKLRIIERI